MDVDYADHKGTFHDVTCPLATKRKVEDTEHGYWYHVKSEELAMGILEMIRRTGNQAIIYLFVRCQDCIAPGG